MQQLPLHIELKTDATFENFVAGDNASLVGQLKSIAQNHSDFLYISGSSGSGKSHLLQALTQSFSHLNPNKLVAYLPLDDTSLMPGMLHGLSGFDCICLDNIHCVIGNDEWELAIFDLYNQLKEHSKSLIITANESPMFLSVKLADLKSRLSAMLIYSVKDLVDEDKKALLFKKAEDKGLELSEDAANFLLTREQRDLSSLVAAIDKLDRASLQAKRKITIPFIKTVLGH